MREIEVEITGLAALGSGVGRVENKAIFVADSCTGDIVRAKITKEKKKYAQAELVEVLKPSEFRVEPACKHYKECGGCQWQHVKYDRQLQEKTQILRSNLLHIGGFDCDFIETIGFDGGYNYRIKTRLQIGEDGKTGFFAKSSNELAEIESCPILHEKLDQLQQSIRKQLKPVLVKSGVTGGFVEIGYSPIEHEAAFHLVTDKPVDEGSLKEIWHQNEEICGFVYGEKGAKVRHGKTRLKLAEDINGFTAYHAIDNFWQTSFHLNNKVKALLDDLLDRVAASCDREEMRAVEIFSGSGNFTQNIARYFAEIIAIESDQKACDSMMKNLKSVKGKIKSVNKNADKGILDCRDTTDFLFLDPPRNGFLSGMEHICSLAPEWIAYLSCDNATFSRDLKVLIENGYNVENIYCLDFFPQTFHIETFCIMRHI